MENASPKPAGRSARKRRQRRHPLYRVRTILATLFFLCITALLLDFSGTLHAYLGWMARVQFLPAVMALHVGIIVGLLVLTLVFGRIYCSVICPLGVMQDGVSRLHSLTRKHRFSYSPAKTWLRWGVVAVFVGLLVAGFTGVAALLAPYSSYGRIVQNLLQPVYIGANNLLARAAEHYDSYAFYTQDVWIRSGLVFAVAVVSLLVVGVLAYRNGRTYCNTLCPVGTVLGFFARFSLFKVHIDKDDCVSCGLCTKNCKAAAIDPVTHDIDYTRCVTCGTCLGHCAHHAMHYSRLRKPAPKLAAAGAPAPSASDSATAAPDAGRRTFLVAAALATSAAALAQEKKKVDGGLAVIEDKQLPARTTPLTPPGSLSVRNMNQHCTACQLCVGQCPNHVLRPSTSLDSFMQPVMQFDRGFCRPECTRCSEVCPTDAIRPISLDLKSAIHIGHAVWVRDNCVPVTNGHACGNCERHCPTGAILMVPLKSDEPDGLQIPTVDEMRCIGCGACEYVCPSRPFIAIYVEGHEQHRFD